MLITLKVAMGHIFTWDSLKESKVKKRHTVEIRIPDLNKEPKITMSHHVLRFFACNDVIYTNSHTCPRLFCKM